MKTIEVGVWVKGKTTNGELIHGYVEKVNRVSETVKVKVTKSDNEEIIGKTIDMLHGTIATLPNEASRSVDEIRALIDLALLTKDDQWFQELSSTLVTLQETKGKQTFQKNALTRNRMDSSLR
ncbi:IDEAL domain-containing protein [Halalkalibacter okhensis]|uniref:IDEAL domain-containing protein n=1 Tax=Halalkalibacter okhensis TaxID=333138 RepID=A0A0B0IJS6_9BACI|nr:IDEAL domain-containing protein [Halalkalibacter okhensis]KHF41575.1 hypothetical protein LQ50_02380 [Halalkalibacter okhensis]